VRRRWSRSAWRNFLPTVGWTPQERINSTNPQPFHPADVAVALHHVRQLQRPPQVVHEPEPDVRRVGRAISAGEDVLGRRDLHGRLEEGAQLAHDGHVSGVAVLGERRQPGVANGQGPGPVWDRAASTRREDVLDANGRRGWAGRSARLHSRTVYPSPMPTPAPTPAIPHISNRHRGRPWVPTPLGSLVVAGKRERELASGGLDAAAQLCPCRRYGQLPATVLFW
jgi:hypothetical protein